MTTGSQAADAGRALEAAGGIAAERYSTPAVLLHWVIALLILAGLPLGLYMVDLPVSPSKLKYYSWHKWIGVTVFLLAVARLVWRAGHRPPAPLPGQPRWQLAVAHAMHVVHRSTRTRGRRGAATRARSGQVARQAPHPVHRKSMATVTCRTPGASPCGRR